MTPLELQQRAAVIAEAESWLSTPYHHEARIKGHGVDCAQILDEERCLFTAYPGCDKTNGSGGCAKFANTARFKGFPFVPVPETAV